MYSIIATIFDIVKDVKYYAYLMDAFLFIFCIIFGIKMSKFKKNEFNKYIKKLSYGYYTDTYKDILNEICLIESYDNIDNNKLIYEYYINNGLYW